jgi:hypothetical protein
LAVPSEMDSMCVRYVEVGPWSVAVESDSAALHDAMALNFGARYSPVQPPASPILLTCRVINDARVYRSAADLLEFDGPEIPLSPGIFIQYDLKPTKTWLKVTQTGLIELDASRPAECQVLLHPAAASSYDGAAKLGPDWRTACPEAFFYPMLAEWVRRVGACLVHGGAVALNGRAVFLTGPSGSGKSTQVLRMVERGASFVADDLALLRRGPDGLRIWQFREVANLKPEGLEAFPELAGLRNAPMRGDGKYMINIRERFRDASVRSAPPGVVLRLRKDEARTLERVPPGEVLDGMYSMAWFGSRPDGNQTHFDLLTDWLYDCPQWYVSRGYMRDCLDELMEQLSEPQESGGML